MSRRRAFPEQPPGSGYGWGGGSWDSRHAEYLRAQGGTLYIWDGRTGRVRAGPHPVGDLVSEVDHSPDGSRVVIAELSGALTLLDGPTLEPAGRPVDLGANVCCVALGPDNRTAFAIVGGPARNPFWNDSADRWALVDLEDGMVVKEGDLGLDNANWATCSPDGRHVAATGYDGDVDIIDTETGQLVREPIEAHGDNAVWAVFSDDGARVVSGAGDGTVILWDAATGNITGRVAGPTVVGARRYLPHVPAERRHHDRPVEQGPRRLHLGPLREAGRRVRLPRGGSRPHRGRVGRALPRPTLPFGVPPELNGRPGRSRPILR